MNKVKPKFNKHYESNDKETSQKLMSEIDSRKEKLTSKEFKNTTTAILFDRNGNATLAHTILKDNRQLIIPEMDLTVMYFSACKDLLERIKSSEKHLIIVTNFDNITKTPTHESELLKCSFEYMSNISSFVILLFTSVECFVNSKIDKNIKILLKDGKGVPYKDIFENKYSTIFKIKDVINIQQSKSFHKSNIADWNRIDRLKKLRDDLVHAKPDSLTSLDYGHIYEKMAKIDYEETLNAVKNFINFYSPKLIDEM